MFIKQRKISTFFGTVKIIAGNISPYASYLSLALVGVMAFYTTVNPVFTEWFGVPLPFWIFCLVLILIVVGTGVIEWVYMMRSYYKANNVQAWDAGGPLQENIAELRRDINLIKKKLEIEDG